MDLPSHGADSGGDTGGVLLDECIHSIVRAVERQQLRNLVLVGHGFAGALLLLAAGQLPSPPKRIVLLAGIVPGNHQSMQSVFPLRTRAGYQALVTVNRLMGREVRLPRSVIGRYLYNGMNPMEVVRQLGLFGPLPIGVLKTRIEREDAGLSSPLTYVVLTQDRLVTPDLQREMLATLPSPEVIELEAGHQAPQSHPQELADILLRYA
jgi:pimeloyl-ACP methyl ester carboxylesterase